ncbi:AAA family ATPase [Rhodobacteraceae bacterium NNCM2]|nr:AAA family ATPase [Coraliihabitans acroporae]
MNREIDKRALERPGGGATRKAARRELNNLFDIAELETRNFDISAMMTAIMRRKWMVAAITLLFGALAFWHLQTVTPLYPATATVVLDTKDEQVIDIEAVATGLSSDYFAINTEVEVLKSRRLLGRLVDDVGLIEDPEFNPFAPQPAAWAEDSTAAWLFGLLGMNAEARPEVPETVQRDETITALANRLEISNIDATYVFEMSIATRDRQKSANLINRLSELYILEQLETKFEATQSATHWLSGRVADLKIALEEAEAEVEAYKTGTQLVSEEELELESRQLKELRDRADGYAIAAAETETLLAAIAAAREAEDIDQITLLVASPRLTRAAQQLASITGNTEQAAQRREQALTNYWAELDRQIAQLGMQLERNRSQAEAAIPAVEAFEARLDAQGNDLVVLRQLVREAEASRLIYEHFLGRMKEISVQEGIQQADARVLSAAIPSMTASYPKRGQTLLLALVLGVIAGSGLALWRESRSSTFRSAEDLERATGLRVLGNLPRAPVRRRRDLLNYVIQKPSSALAESVRDLRTSLLLADMRDPPKVIVSSSSVPREGKTTMTVLLAQNSAALGKKVLVVECDLRKRTLDAYFGGQKAQRGMISVLYGEAEFEDVVLRDEQAGFDVLPGEETNVNAADVFSSLQFERFISTMRDRYDFVIIDTPPVMAVPDARLIAVLGDALIYSVAWDKTSRDLVRAGLNQFREIDIPLVGLALTQIDLGKAARYGYGGYGQYYKAGKGYYNN